MSVPAGRDDSDIVTHMRTCHGIRIPHASVIAYVSKSTYTTLIPPPRPCRLTENIQITETLSYFFHVTSWFPVETDGGGCCHPLSVFKIWVSRRLESHGPSDCILWTPIDWLSAIDPEQCDFETNHVHVHSMGIHLYDSCSRTELEQKRPTEITDLDRAYLVGAVLWYAEEEGVLMISRHRSHDQQAVMIWATVMVLLSPRYIYTVLCCIGVCIYI